MSKLNLNSKYEDLKKVIDNFSQFNTFWTVRLIRAYTLYFHIANVVEHIYRIDDLSSNNYSIESLNNKLKNLLFNNYNSEKDLINLVDIKLVFTAHPTEAARPEILNQINGYFKNIFT